MNRWQHIIFDFDGVVADTLGHCLEVLNGLRPDFPELPPAVTQTDLALVFPGPLKTSLRRFNISDDRARQFFDRHSAGMLERAANVRAFDGMVPMLAALPRGRFSFVTSAQKASVESLLIRSTTKERLEPSCILSRELRLSKAEKISMILSKHGLAASDVLHVGDMVGDLIASFQTNVPFCAVGWGYHPLNYLRSFDPPFWAATTIELEALL